MLNEDEQYALLSYYRSKVENLEDINSQLNHRLTTVEQISSERLEQLTQLNRIPDGQGSVTAEALKEFMASLVKNEKIKAIKMARMWTHLGLKEAKELVESAVPYDHEITVKQRNPRTY